jgi:hypothetical protein
MPSRTRSRRGRPPKYGRAARAVTITLPEDVLARLLKVDSDLGRAIVRLAQRSGRTHVVQSRRPADLLTWGSHALIVVDPARALRRIPGVRLVPIGDGRSLISLDPQYSLSALELEIRDALESRDTGDVERRILNAIREILRQARQSRSIAARLRTIIVVERKSRRAP